MPITPRQWLEFAERILGNDEAASRSAASRAYYAAFHASRALSDALPNPPTPPAIGGMHDRAIRALAHCPIRKSKRERDKAIRKIGIILGQARDIRTKADYDTKLPFTREEGQEAIDLAKRVFELLEQVAKLDITT
jgi:uncharacterized protein (UPF0332 family)